jgi:hypothetical protein
MVYLIDISTRAPSVLFFTPSASKRAVSRTVSRRSRCLLNGRNPDGNPVLSAS